MDLNTNIGVQPLAFITRPFTITPLTTPVYYCSTILNCSMHRPDGKKLPFVSGFFKASFEEDRDYLDKEIEIGNIYIRRANTQEQEQARMMEDPLGVIKDHMRADVRKEVTEGFNIEELETLLERKRAEKLENQGIPIGVQPHTSGASAAPGASAIPANETPEQKRLRLSHEARTLAISGRFAPASSADFSTTSESNSR
jgi:ribosomal protein L13E